MIPCSCEWLYQSAARASLSLTSSRRWSSGSWHTPHHGLRSLHRAFDTHLSPAVCLYLSVHFCACFMLAFTYSKAEGVSNVCPCFTEMKQHQYTLVFKSVTARSNVATYMHVQCMLNDSPRVPTLHTCCGHTKLNFEMHQIMYICTYVHVHFIFIVMPTFNLCARCPVMACRYMWPVYMLHWDIVYTCQHFK